MYTLHERLCYAKQNTKNVYTHMRYLVCWVTFLFGSFSILFYSFRFRHSSCIIHNYTYTYISGSSLQSFIFMVLLSFFLSLVLVLVLVHAHVVVLVRSFFHSTHSSRCQNRNFCKSLVVVCLLCQIYADVKTKWKCFSYQIDWYGCRMEIYWWICSIPRILAATSNISNDSLIFDAFFHFFQLLSFSVRWSTAYI